MARYITGSAIKGFLQAFVDFCDNKSPIALNKPTAVGADAPGLTVELCAGDAEATAAAKAEDGIRAAPGTATVVLGVGNQPFLSMVDVLCRVFCFSECVLLKHHPLRQYLIHPYEEILRPLIEADVVR